MPTNTVPGNWKYSYLKDAMAKVIGGGTPPRAIARYWKGNIPWASVKDFQDDTLLLHDTQEHISREGLIKSAANEITPNTLVICTRMAIGRAAIVELPTAINQDLKALYPKSHLQTRFLLYFLHQNRQMLEVLSIGSTVKGITTNKLLSLTIGIPPIYEQCCITHILDTLDTQIQQTEQIIAKLKQIKAGLLHDLLTRGIDENGESRDPVAHPEEFKKTFYGNLKIPTQWNIHPLEKIAKISSGLTLGRRLIGVDTIELPYLRVANVQDGYLDLIEIKYIRVPKHEVDRFLLQPGDVLMTEGGDFDKLGRGTLWTGEIPNCLHQNHIFKVRTDRRYLHPEFLALISRSSYGKHFFLLSSKQSTNLASINSTQLKAFLIPCPTKEEQERIVNISNSHDARITAEESHLAKLKQLKKGLMHDLLTGHVRVTQLIAESEQLDVRSKCVSDCK